MKKPKKKTRVKFRTFEEVESFSKTSLSGLPQWLQDQSYWNYIVLLEERGVTMQQIMFTKRDGNTLMLRKNSRGQQLRCCSKTNTAIWQRTLMATNTTLGKKFEYLVITIAKMLLVETC